MGSPKKPSSGHWELDLPRPAAPAADAPAPPELDRNEPPPPTPVPAVERDSRVPDLSVADEPISGEFGGLLFHGNVLEEEAEGARASSIPAPPPAPASFPARAVEVVPELSWTPAPVAPAHATPAPPPRATPAPPPRATPAPPPRATPAPPAHATPAPPSRTPGYTPAPTVPRASGAALQPDPELRRRLEQSWARSTSWPGMTEEQHRVALSRSTLEVLGSADRVESLADGLVHAIVHIQARVHGTAPWLLEAIVARLPRESLLAACPLVARWAPTVAEQEGDGASPWLDAAARITEAVAAAHARSLPEGAVDLLRALEQEGSALTRRMEPALRDWIRAGRYVRTGQNDAQAATAALDAARTPFDYAAELDSVERAVPLLIAGRRWEAVAPLVVALARHAIDDESFPWRARLARGALDRIYVPRVLSPIVQALADGSTPHEVLSRVLSAGGPRVVQAVAEIMERTSAAPVRRLAAEVLAAHPAEARAHALAMLAEATLPPVARRTAFELLGVAGQPDDALVIAQDRDHPSEEVRCTVLWAATALVRERAQGLLLRAVDDPSRVVQARAINLLGQIRTSDRNVLHRLADLLDDESPAEDSEGVVSAALWALSYIGNVPIPGRGASVEKLLVTIAARPRPAGLRRVLGARSAEMWWRPQVRVALCHALATLGTERAIATLRAIGETPDDPARDEARRILAQMH